VAALGVTDDAALFLLTDDIVGHTSKENVEHARFGSHGPGGPFAFMLVVEPMNLAERAHRSSRLAATSPEVHRGRF
jgi:hypothetical protein